MPKEKQVDKQWLPTQLSQGHPGINSGFHGNRYKSLVVDPAISCQRNRLMNFVSSTPQGTIRALGLPGHVHSELPEVTRPRVVSMSERSHGPRRRNKYARRRAHFEKPHRILP